MFLENAFFYLNFMFQKDLDVMLRYTTEKPV